MKTGQHIPTRWPEGRPRTTKPREADFSGDLTLTRAVRMLVEELERKRWANGVIVAAGHGTARMTGLADHSAAVYFSRATQSTGSVANGPDAGLRWSSVGVASYVFACDRFDRVQHNVWALYLHAKAKRAEDRYGICTAEEALAGYAALPPSPDAAPYVPPQPVGWREWLDLALFKKPTVDTIKAHHAAKLIALRISHPDGSHPREPYLNNARDEAIAAAERGGW